ncbi:DUF2960 family protein [Aeromonas simiae]|uniref:DUF2960 family protein n=1 Tax=Aeromonas simiae TaxID=218936 RepID=A0A5J6WRK1_9GAMM|nr:DUF2960 family protein [Aeromonas simiae]MDO2948441.1 DUF2960 domain-containing protein [Aeromonas simiae]MDO2951892.1 DUF2960 domain-containing protein [Aeromonas simiae]MDO2955824.1 DUF2960 domain-containing protein [Aeromonas simiae]QFI53460.1 DUF2960 family protein [Aeromonas simiae]
MAFTITYRYRKQLKSIGYANDKHHSIYDAIATAEGIDLARYRAMEEQVVNISRRDRKMLKEFRENYFRELGFSDIAIVRDEQE